MSLLNKLKISRKALAGDTRAANLRQQKINKFLIKYYHWLVALTMLVVLTAGYFLLIQPKYQEMRGENEMTSQELQQAYAAKQTLLGNLNQLEQSYNQIKQADKDKINAMLPAKAEVERLISELEAIVLKNGLILASLSIEPQEKAKTSTKVEIKDENSGQKLKIAEMPEGVALVKISMGIVGSDYNGLKNLLRTIENNLRLLDIDKLDYNNAENKASLDLTAYYLP